MVAQSFYLLYLSPIDDTKKGPAAAPAPSRTGVGLPPILFLPTQQVRTAIIVSSEIRRETSNTGEKLTERERDREKRKGKTDRDREKRKGKIYRDKRKGKIDRDKRKGKIEIRESERQIEIERRERER